MNNENEKNGAMPVDFADAMGIPDQPSAWDEDVQQPEQPDAPDTAEPEQPEVNWDKMMHPVSEDIPAVPAGIVAAYAASATADAPAPDPEPEPVSDPDPAPEESVPEPADDPADDPADKPAKKGLPKKAKAIGIAALAAAVIIAAAVIVLSRFALIGGSFVSRDIASLDLQSRPVSMVSEICRCRSLTQLDLRGSDISVGQFRRLRRNLPECEILWDVPVCGEKYPNTAEVLDLSGRSDLRLSKVRRALPGFEALTQVIMSDCGFGDDELLGFEEKTGVDIVWDTDVCGSSVSTGSEVIYAKDCPDFDYNELLPKLKYFTSLTAVDLTGCGMNVDTMLDYDRMLKSDAGVPCVWDVEIGGETYSTALTSLSIESAGLTDDDIAGLRGFVNLTDLRLSDNAITDISPISGLVGLRVLILRENAISDISPISALTDLVYLDLSGGDRNDRHVKKHMTVSDISAISGLTKLQYIGLDNNLVSDLTALAGLNALTELQLSGNEITDITPLTGLPALTILSLDENEELVDIMPLAQISTLECLSIYKIGAERDASKELRASMPDCDVYYTMRYKHGE